MIHPVIFGAITAIFLWQVAPAVVSGRGGKIDINSTAFYISQLLQHRITSEVDMQDIRDQLVQTTIHTLAVAASLGVDLEREITHFIQIMESRVSAAQ